MSSIARHLGPLLLLLCSATQAAGGPAQSVALNIEAQPVDQALTVFAQQTGLQLMFRADAGAANFTAPRLVGRFTPDAALSRLLANTGLAYEFLDESTVTIRPKPKHTAAQPPQSSAAHTSSSVAAGASQLRLARADDEVVGQTRGASEEATDTADGTATPEMLVKGSRALNMDIRRTQNDTQPYVIFDRQEIEDSGATSVQEFFRKKLSASSTSISNSQGAYGTNKSVVNLRGLGTDETLVLVDGRRLAPYSDGGAPLQPDLNGIPLSSIERIEVLPTTASGIYGGGATGGVINVVLRRDYSGVETRLTYGNSFSSDVTERRMDLSAGFSFDGGRTSISLTGSYADSNPLLAQERALVERGRAWILERNPMSFYGSQQPPLGRTSNVRSADGSNLVLDGGMVLNSPFSFVPEDYAGRSSDGGLGLAANAGRYNLDLADSAQTGGGRSALLSATRVKSAMMSVRREFTPGVSAFLELRASDNSMRIPFNPANFSSSVVTITGDAPNNPFEQDIDVTLPALGVDGVLGSGTADTRAVGGIIVALPAQWRAAVDLTWNRTRTTFVGQREINAATIAAIGNGTLDILRDINIYPVALQTESTPNDSTGPSVATLRNATVRLSGPLPWSLPGGRITLSTLLERREERMDELIIVSSNTQSLVPDRSQSVDSAYLEAKVPFVSAVNSRAGLDLLELQLAVRADSYKINGAPSMVSVGSTAPIDRRTNEESSVDPTIGMRYRPVRDVTFRASYGTGYLPPTVSQLVPIPPFSFNLGFFLSDPLRGYEPLGFTEYRQGGNPDLMAEESESLSAGIILEPHWIPGLRFSADWSRIDKTNNITAISLFQQSALEQAIMYFPERVHRGAPSGGYDVGPITVLDSTAINVAELYVEALDLALEYQTSIGRFGDLGFSASGTRNLSIESRVASAAPLLDYTGVFTFTDLTTGGLKWRGNMTANWFFKNLHLGWTLRYYDGYFLNPARVATANQGAATVPGQTYHDLFGSYSFGATNGFLAGMRLSFGVNNVLNTRPPVDTQALGSGYYSTLGDPRMANYYLSITRSFGQ